MRSTRTWKRAGKPTLDSQLTECGVDSRLRAVLSRRPAMAGGFLLFVCPVCSALRRSRAACTLRACVQLALAAKWLDMKILGVSDQEVDKMYDLVPQGHFAGVDMIIGCGDLHYGYLEYLVTVLNVDLFYVPGNHDTDYNPGSLADPAPGCMNLDLKTISANGFLMAGFGGSIRYRPNGGNQYTQTQAFLRLARLVPKLWRNRLRYGRALDVLITHSPPYGVHDDESRAHRGLKAINWLMAWAKPRYLLHGHMHFQQSNLNRDVTWQGTTSVMNVYPYRVIEVQDAG
jgi:hypothetical protein